MCNLWVWFVNDALSLCVACWHEAGRGQRHFRYSLLASKFSKCTANVWRPLRSLKHRPIITASTHHSCSFFLFTTGLLPFFSISFFSLLHSSLLGQVIVINKDSNNFSWVPSLMRQEVAIRCRSWRTQPLWMPLQVGRPFSGRGSRTAISFTISWPILASDVSIRCVVMMIMMMTVISRWWSKWRRWQGKHGSLLVSCSHSCKSFVPESGICDSQSNKSHEKSETRKECVRMSAKEGVKSADQTNQWLIDAACDDVIWNSLEMMMVRMRNCCDDESRHYYDGVDDDGDCCCNDWFLDAGSCH